MEHPSARRMFHTEGKQPLRYKKVKGTSGIEGQIFEYKFCALTYLKSKNDGLNFKLGCNVEGFEIFDDVVVEYLDSSRRTSHICVQLKRKKRHTITEKQLLAKRGDFSLIKHYESYIDLEKMFKSRQQGDETVGSTDECLFIIYTNADVEKDLKSDILTELGQEEFLNTGGNVLKFSEETHKGIYEHMKEKPRYVDFLSRYRLMYKQANEIKMDGYIIPLLEKQLKFHDSERESACQYFCGFIQDWWKMEDYSYFLQQTNLKENDPLQKTSEKLLERSVERKLVEWRSKFDNPSIKYKQSAITDMKLLTETQKAVLIFAPGRSTRLTAAKIHQKLNDTSHIILNLNQLIPDKTEVMWAWKHKLDILVLDSQESSAENIEDVVNEISIFLNEYDDRKKFIFISSGIGNIQQTSAIRNTFSTNLTEHYDEWKFTELVTESQMIFLEKKVDFQGGEIKLSKIVSKDDVGMLNALGYDSASQLLENKKFSIGIPIKDTVEYYIDRTLQCNKEVQTRVPVQGEIKSAFNKDILLEFQDISSNRENESERKPSPGVQPSTLIEVDGRVILVTDEPGMGKSTLLTHLAKQTRERQPDIWIVRVDINNYTRILNEIKANGCIQTGVIKLLTEAAKIRETDGLNLETCLFDNYCSSTGNMVVLIDGVDEVSPLYTEEVVQVLKFLMKTKIKKIWLTSRNSVKDRLEKEFHCQSYFLVPFNEEDQKHFLVKFWKHTCPEIEDDYLDKLANQVVKLSTEQLNVQDKKFMGIPLQSLLLGEMFEGNLKEYSTSSTVELPEHINVVMLYNLYVEKKWGIYIQEKKGSDRTKVMVIDDDAKLQTTFIHNHMAAALVAILSTQQVEKLADKTIAQRGSDFLQNIADGIEKTGIIIEVFEGQPIFQHRTLAEYLVARWLSDNFQNGQMFIMDHLLEPGFRVVRSMFDRILADKCSLHEAVLNSNLTQVEKLLQKKESMTAKDLAGRTPLHVAVSCCSPKLIQLLLEHGADVSSVDNLLSLSPVQYAIRMADWEMLSFMMEKRNDVSEQVLNDTNLTNWGLVKEIHPSILKKVVELTLAAMENFPTHYQLQKNSLLILYSKTVLQGVEFDKYHCARLVLDCLCTFDDPSMNLMSVTICSTLLKKISKCEKSDLGSQPQYLRKILSIVKSKLQKFCVDDTMFFTLRVLTNLTDQTSTTCSVILEEGGIDLFLKVLVTFKEEQIVMTRVLIVINNIAEVPQLRPYLMLPDFMAKIRELLHSANNSVSYSAAGIIAHMASGGAETWVVDVVLRQKLLQELGDAVKRWNASGFRTNTGYNSFQPLFPLLTSHEAFEVQLWAVWTIQYLCTTNAKRYCPMLIEEGVREKLQQLQDSDEVNPSVRDICLNILDILAVEQ